MRISTKFATGLMGVGVLALSFKLGLPATQATALSPAPPNATLPTETTSPTAKPTPTNKPLASKVKPAAPTKPNTPAKPAPPEAPVSPPTTLSTSEQLSDVIKYKFGKIQLAVIKDSAGAITSVNTVLVSATGGRQAAFASLTSAAVAAQGSSFGNISQATYTTQAVKDALDSALAKF